jgi:hypothetical protein
MVDRGEVTAANGILTIFKVMCRRCGLMRLPEEMGNLYWCKKCHAKAQREWQKKHPKPKKPSKRALLDRLLAIAAKHQKIKKQRCRCILCQTVQAWQAEIDTAEQEEQNRRKKK